MMICLVVAHVQMGLAADAAKPKAKRAARPKHEARLPQFYAEVAELFRFGAKHPYVPDHIWEEIPWW